MKISAEQEAQLRGWLASRMTLPEIYKKVAEDWKLSMTYMDLRFLIDDLGLEFLPPLPVVEKAEEVLKGEAGFDPEAESEVSVTVDKVVRPGALASGSVRFSDGQTAAWQFDQAGRIALIPSNAGYKPSQEDIQEFQMALQEAMHKSGY